MKRLFNIICVLFLLLVSCQKDNKMTLNPTKEISNEIITYYKDYSTPISYDFVIDSKNVDYELIQYELINGKWSNPLNFFGNRLNNSKGSFALIPEYEPEHMAITTIEGSIDNGFRSFGTGYDIDNRIFQYISLNEEVNIEYEKEIPILIQIKSDNKINLTFNSNTNELKNQLKDYEEVYLITVKFTKY